MRPKATSASFCIIMCSLVAMVTKCLTPPPRMTVLTTSYNPQRIISPTPTEYFPDSVDDSKENRILIWPTQYRLLYLTLDLLCRMRADSSLLDSPITPAWSLASHHSTSLSTSFSLVPSWSAASATPTHNFRVYRPLSSPKHAIHIFLRRAVCKGKSHRLILYLVYRWAFVTFPGV